MFDSLAAQSLREPGASRQQALRALDLFRQFATGSGVHAVFDAPWTLVYLVVSFLIHPLIGAQADQPKKRNRYSGVAMNDYFSQLGYHDGR